MHTSCTDHAVACGESPLRYTAPATCTIGRWLWLAGNRRSDTLCGSSEAAEPFGCGLRGIAAQIHFGPLRSASDGAVACGESSLRYTAEPLVPGGDRAVACGESSLRYTAAHAPLRSAAAVACGESPLRYTLARFDPHRTGAVACGESPLRYTADDRAAGGGLRCGLRGIAAQIHSIRSTGSSQTAVACGESPLRYTSTCNLRSTDQCCGLRGIAAQIHFCAVVEHATNAAVACGESPLRYTRGSRSAA